MKTRLKLNWLVVIVIALTGLLPAARAFYAPAAQRWLNRDPLNAQMPQGNQSWGGSRKVEVEQGPNLYFPFANNPITKTDKDGLAALFLESCWLKSFGPTSCTYDCYLLKIADVPFTGPTKQPAGKYPGITIPALCGFPCILSPYWNLPKIYE